jgi:hypothetical protein
VQRLADRLPTCSTDIQVRGAPPAVGDREDLAGGEHAKAEQWDGHADCDAHQHVGGRLHPKVDVGDGDQGYQHGRHPLAGLAPPALRYQAVQDAHHEHH